jgi:hypothetical protein
MKHGEVELELKVRIPGHLWRSFRNSARRQGQRPEARIQEAAVDFIRGEAFEELLERSSREAQRNLPGYGEEDAVELVREHRRERAQEMANGRKKAAHARRGGYQRVRGLLADKAATQSQPHAREKARQRA